VQVFATIVAHWKIEYVHADIRLVFGSLPLKGKGVNRVSVNNHD
jgi:hypothetical protein